MAGGEPRSLCAGLERGPQPGHARGDVGASLAALRVAGPRRRWPGLDGGDAAGADHHAGRRLRWCVCRCPPA
eukprot:121186-Rhodomonas_salina.3